MDTWEKRIAQLKTFVQNILSIANSSKTEILVMFWWDLTTCTWEKSITDLHAAKGGPSVNVPRSSNGFFCFKYLNGSNPKVIVAALIPKISDVVGDSSINRSMSDYGFRVPYEYVSPSCRKLGKRLCSFFGVPHLFKSVGPNAQEKGKEVANPRDLYVPSKKVVCLWETSSSSGCPLKIPTTKRVQPQEKSPSKEEKVKEVANPRDLVASSSSKESAFPKKKRKRPIITKLYHHGSKDSTFTRIKYVPGARNSAWFSRVLQVVCKLSICIRMNIKVHVLVSDDRTEMAIVPADFFDDFNWKGSDIVEVSTYGELLDMCKHEKQELISKVYGRL